MAACPPETRNAFLADLRSTNAEARSGTTPKRATDKDGMWRQWLAYIATIPSTNPYLSNLEPHLHLSFLKVFAARVRDGRSATKGRPVRAKRVQDYLRTVAEEIRLGSTHHLDPRFDQHHRIDRTLQLLTKAHSKQDPPPDKVKPVPIQLVRHAYQSILQSAMAHATTLANMLVIGYFFLLRPGEYTYDANNNHPFRLQDITFATPRGLLNAATAPERDLRQATRVLLNFTDQKNGQRDQAITQGDTPDPAMSPVQAVLRQVLYLRQHRAPADTPLHTYFDPSGRRHVTAKMITAALKASCADLGPSLGLTPQDITARALRNGGCMALIRAGIDPLHARLMGRWKSWAMLEYLHNSSIDTSDYAARMLTGGDFVIPSHQKLPADVLTLAQAYLE